MTNIRYSIKVIGAKQAARHVKELNKSIEKLKNDTITIAIKEIGKKKEKKV
jgi:hypothetical protein